MLEQPPEKSEMEIAAEIAAAAQQQMSAPNRAQGCLRFIIWCTPALVVGLMSLLAANIPFAYLISLPILIFLTLVAIYGIGYFDGMLHHKTYAVNPQKRQKKIHAHATKFFAWQFLIIPGIAALLFGACVVFVTTSLNS